MRTSATPISHLPMIALCGVLALAGCGGDDGGTPATQTFSLKFTATAGGEEVGCGDTIENLSASGASVQISDLRFYVSNVQFHTDDGRIVDAALDENAFQYVSNEGSAALIDLTGTSGGACAGTGLSYPEGTARTNKQVTGTAPAGRIERVTFDVGLPQSLMKAVIANHTAEDAPSPMAELHWSWAYAYRFFIRNFTVEDDGGAGEGYFHVGSTDCGGDGTRALTDRQACGYLNTAKVSLSPFDPATDTIAVDIRSLLAGLDFRIAVDETSEVGVECHSSMGQPDCGVGFANLGIDIASGTSNAALDDVFSVR